MEKRKIDNNISQKIQGIALGITNNTIGKSVPFMIHEVVLPKELKNINKKVK